MNSDCLKEPTIFVEEIEEKKEEPEEAEEPKEPVEPKELEPSYTQSEVDALPESSIKSIFRRRPNRRRHRLTRLEVAVLEVEYQREPRWDKRKTKELAQRYDLDRVKIYKWHYDRKKKDARLNIVTP